MALSKSMQGKDKKERSAILDSIMLSDSAKIVERTTFEKNERKRP